MLQLETRGAVTILTLDHGPVNAMDVSCSTAWPRRSAHLPALSSSPAGATASPQALTCAASSPTGRPTQRASSRHCRRRSSPSSTTPDRSSAAINGHAVAGGWCWRWLATCGSCRPGGSGSSRQQSASRSRRPRSRSAGTRSARQSRQRHCAPKRSRHPRRRRPEWSTRSSARPCCSIARSSSLPSSARIRRPPTSSRSASCIGRCSSGSAVRGDRRRSARGLDVHRIGHADRRTGGVAVQPPRVSKSAGGEREPPAVERAPVAVRRTPTARLK